VSGRFNDDDIDVGHADAQPSSYRALRSHREVISLGSISYPGNEIDAAGDCLVVLSCHVDVAHRSSFNHVSLDLLVRVPIAELIETE